MTVLSPDNTTAAPGGPPDDRARDAWLLLALLTPGDVDAANTLWRAHAPPSLAGLLDGTGGWSWDDQRQQYSSRTGRTLGGMDLKRLALLFAMAVEEDMRREASNMSVGIKPLATWERDMADLIKDVNIAEAALARGGLSNLDAPALARVSGLPAPTPGQPILIPPAVAPPGIAFSLDRLQSFAADVAEAVKPAMTSEDGIVARASLYAAASQSTFEDAKRESHRAARDGKGRALFLFERNILGEAQHCSNGEFTEGCIEVTRAGWSPIGTLPLPGLRTCGPNCACELIFSLVGDTFTNN